MAESLGSWSRSGKKSFKLTISGGFDGSGKRIRHTKTFHAISDNPDRQEKEADQALGLFKEEIRKGQNTINGKMTLNEFFDYWLENHSEGNHAPKTISYNKGLFKRIRLAMGNLRLNQISPKHLLEFYKNLSEHGIRQDPNEARRKNKPATAEQTNSEEQEEKPKKDTLSPNTIKKYHVLLHTLFEKAMQWQLMAYNPASRVESPKAIRSPKTVYDEETTGRFILCLEQEELRHRTMALMALSTGMRRGELFGLQWKHIDLTKGTINIEQASQYLPEKGIFQKDPKNENSKRIISIPESIVALIRKYKAEQLARRLKLGKIKEGGKWEGTEEPEDDFVFTKWNGLPAIPDSFNTWLNKFITKNNLPKLTPHGFRHMAATYLLTAGNTDLRTVSGKLGHANSATTQIIYSHLLKSAEEETANKMDSFIKQATQKAKEAKEAKKRQAK